MFGRTVCSLNFSFMLYVTYFAATVSIHGPRYKFYNAFVPVLSLYILFSIFNCDIFNLRVALFDNSFYQYRPAVDYDDRFAETIRLFSCTRIPTNRLTKRTITEASVSARSVVKIVIITWTLERKFFEKLFEKERERERSIDRYFITRNR